MYKIKNRYKDCHIMDLNLIDVRSQKKLKISTPEILLTAVPLVLAAFIIGAAFIPELSFFAECQNIPGGDICSITLK